MIRNKCAHGKSGKIEYYHIESLWNFIQENFYKFVVNGGKTGVMQQIEDYYDRTITPFWNLLEKIILRNMVPDVEKKDFNKSLFKRIGKNIPSEHKKILEKTDYFSKLREVLLSVFNYKHSDGINFANANCHQFVKFIKVCGLDKDSVRCINQIFSFATFGMFYDEIKKLMKQEDYLEQYESIVTENSMENYKSEFVSE